MPSDALSRKAVVRALDDLGEREQIPNDWRSDDTDDPYPPEAIHERSQRLREQLQWRRGAFILLMLLIGATGALGLTGWTIPDSVFGALLGFGIGVVIASLFPDPWAEDQVQALQLYDLLEELDETKEVA